MKSVQVFCSIIMSSFMHFAFDCMQDDRSPVSDIEEEEESCDPQKPSENPEQVLGL